MPHVAAAAAAVAVLCLLSWSLLSLLLSAGPLHAFLSQSFPFPSSPPQL